MTGSNLLQVLMRYIKKKIFFQYRHDMPDNGQNNFQMSASNADGMDGGTKIIQKIIDRYPRRPN